MDNTNTKIESAQQKEQFVSFLRYIKRKKRVVILITTLGILLGIAYSLIKKPVYTASLTFSLQEETKMSGGGLLSLASSFGLDMGSSSGIFSGDNIEQVFKSRKILEKTLFQPYPNTSKTYGDWFLQTSGLNIIMPKKYAMFSASIMSPGSLMLKIPELGPGYKSLTNLKLSNLGEKAISTPFFILQIDINCLLVTSKTYLPID